MHTNSYNNVNGKGLRFAIVRARFNEQVTQGLLDAALTTLFEAGVEKEDVTVVEVPGSFEIPVVAGVYARSGNVDAVLALGCIIKGETMHDYYLASSVYTALAQLSSETGVPVTVGVLTVNSQEQAEVRSGDSSMNRGHEAAATALEMADWKRGLRN